MVVQTVRLHEINYVKTVWLASFRIADSEIVPLSIAPRVVVWLKDEVILKLINLNCSSQVTSFNATFENKCIIIRTIRYVKLSDFSFNWTSNTSERTLIDAIVHNSIH